MQMTTIRVRRARTDTLKAAGVDPGDRELVEVTAHGQPIAVVDVDVVKQGERSRPSDPLIWHAEAFDDSLTRELERLVIAALPLMEQARRVSYQRVTGA